MFQRVGSVSNAHVGKEFECSAKEYFERQGIALQENFSLPIGIGEKKKGHAFDLGAHSPKIIVECKSHKWTAGANIPSAKLTVWNEAMYYFSIAPTDYRKILFVLHDYSEKRKLTLAQYYCRINSHLIPDGVEIIEFNEQTGHAGAIL